MVETIMAAIGIILGVALIGVIICAIVIITLNVRRK